MSQGSIEPVEPAQLAAESRVFVAYLAQFGLPTDNIIATTEERGVIAANLPSFLSTLPTDVKKDARYLSKVSIQGSGRAAARMRASLLIPE